MTKGNGNGSHRRNGLGGTDDPLWNSVEGETQRFVQRMSDQTHRRTAPDIDDERSPPLDDPREATEFCAVWDKIYADPASRHLIDYINGAVVEPVPTLRDIVMAFRRAGEGAAIYPEQISMVIAICGGQLSRHAALRKDVVAEWRAAAQRLKDGAEDAQEAREAGVPQAQTVPVFLKGSLQPSYLIEPILQRSTLYTITALTSHGKTAVLLYIALMIASGRSVAGKHTVRGRVVWLAGENPDDFAMKIATACAHWDIDPAELDMVVIPGSFDLGSQMEDAVKMAAAGGDVAMVVVDTSAAYRMDEDEDDNPSSTHWARTMRGFVRMPGRPVVILATHPTKYAEPNTLLPRGGGGFINEVDGNMSLWADEEQATTSLHWCGKWRGMTFAPIAFELHPCPHPTWRLRNGEPVMIKLAVPTGEEVVRRPPTETRSRTGRPASDKADIARNILADIIVTEGRSGWAPGDLLAVPKDRWRQEFYSRACIAEDNPENRKKAFQRAVNRLQEANVVAANNDWVWLTHPEVE